MGTPLQTPRVVARTQNDVPDNSMIDVVRLCNCKNVGRCCVHAGRPQAAFGAPLGGVLFAVEEARGQWTRRLGWLSLLTASLATMLGAQLRPRCDRVVVAW